MTVVKNGDANPAAVGDPAATDDSSPTEGVADLAVFNHLAATDDGYQKRETQTLGRLVI